MMNCEKFLDIMRGEYLLVRLNVHQQNESISSADGRVYAYYTESEGVPYAVEIVFTCNQWGTFQPLGLNPFPHDDRKWPRHIESIIEGWEYDAWSTDKVVVCRHMSGKHGLRLLDPGHPTILHHLCVLQGMLAATDVEPIQKVLLDVAARRIDGLIRGQIKVWSKLV